MKLILPLLFACGPLSEYNIGYASDRARELSLTSIDLGVKILAEELEKADLISAYDAEELISHGFLLVSAIDEIPFSCYGVPSVACLVNNVVVLGFKPEFNNCIARTAYLHELTHFILCQRLGNIDGTLDCDGEHRMSDWWKVADHIASSKFEDKECPVTSENIISSLTDWKTYWKHHPEVIVDPRSVWSKR